MKRKSLRPQTASVPSLQPKPWSKRRWNLTAIILLLIITIPWWQAVRLPFIHMDDALYLSDNPDMHSKPGEPGGLNFTTFLHSFTTIRGAAWMPMTWISLLVDRRFFGVSPVGFHATNVALHIANAILLYFFLSTLTRSRARSLAAAALFAMHPLRVESVAWVAERKDVLFTFFGLLALIAYVRFAAGTRHRWAWFTASCFLYALSLMSKIMLITLPALLLLLDYWPLQRLSAQTWKRRLLEKLPFLAMAIAAYAVTSFAIRQENAVLNLLTPLQRFQNAFLSYAFYLRDQFYFNDLSVYYPIGGSINTGAFFGSILLMIAISIAVIMLWRKIPSLGAPLCLGWFWFAGTLVPVIGFIIVGSQARADRFTYFPAIGLLIAFVWPWPASWFKTAFARLAATLTVSSAVVYLSVYMTLRLLLWRDPLALYIDGLLHTTPQNAMLNTLAGNAIAGTGDPNNAIPFFNQAIAASPQYADAHFSLGLVLDTTGRHQEALHEFQIAHQLMPAVERYKSAYEKALARPQNP